MAQALVRNLDDEILDLYRSAARTNGRSLEAELRDALERAKPSVRSDASELKALSKRLRATTSHGPPQDDSTQTIRRYRETQGGRWVDDGRADAPGS